MKIPPRPRPKLCHLIHDGSAYGGGNTFSRSDFPAYLAEYDTFAIVGRGELARRLRESGVRTITLPMARPWTALLSLPLLWFLLLRERPDALVLHGQWGGFFGALAGRLAGVRAVVYSTQFPSFYTDWTLFKIVRNHLAEKWTCALSDRVICLSWASRYQYILRRLVPTEKIVYVPNGVPPLDLTAAPDRAALLLELGLPADTVGALAVSVSRLTDQKRIDWLLRAWARVEQEDPAAILAIVGGGPDDASLRRLAAELRLRRCHFLGPRAAGYRYFHAADFGIICSLFEAANAIALTEAMFVGCPMIGTAVDGIAETILPNETGLLVPPADPPALAAAILTFIRNPAQAQKMAQAALALANIRYRLDDVIAQQLKVVREVMAEQQNPSSGARHTRAAESSTLKR